MTYLAADCTTMFPEDEVTRVDPSGPRAIRHRNLLRCALLLHKHHSTWGPEQVELWRKVVGTDVSARALCAAINGAGIDI